MDDRLQGSLVLCSQVYEDRGNLTLLGLPWNLIEPGKTTVWVAAILTVHHPAAGGELSVEVRLREHGGDVMKSGTIQGQAGATGVAVELPTEQAVVPIRWNLEVAPDTTYVVEMLCDDVVIATTSFAAAPPSAGSDAEGFDQ